MFYFNSIFEQEISTIPELEHAMQLNEMEKLQIVTDVTEAVSFLHNLSQVLLYLNMFQHKWFFK